MIMNVCSARSCHGPLSLAKKLDMSVRSVQLRKPYRVPADARAVLLAALDVAAIVNPTVQPGDARLLLHGREIGSALREQVRQDRRGGGREGGVARRVRREIRQPDHRLDARIKLS